MYDSPGEALKCRVIDNLVYLADGSGGLRVINVSSPNNPVEAGYLVPPGLVNSVFAPRPTLIYIAAADNGLLAATFNTGIEESASSPLLTCKFNPVVPNPFKQDALVTFQIPNSELVFLRLFDVQGRLVKSLVETKLKPGDYNYHVSTKELPSGIYLLRLNAGKYQGQQKLILIK